MLKLPGICLTMVFSGAALCQLPANQPPANQPPAKKPAFEIADIHFSPRGEWSRTVAHWTDGDTLGGDRYEVRRATLLDLVRIAYNVDADKIFGGPGWIDYDRYEIAAKTRPGTPRATLRLMLQALLEDRFHLVVKPDTQPVQGYRLSIGKGGPKLSPAANGGDSAGCQSKFRHDPGGAYNDFQCHNMTMGEFATFLLRRVSAPVEDATGLDGGWDLDFTLAEGSLASGPNKGGILDLVEKLGLKLEPGKVLQPVLTVERADEQPSANAPGTAEALPPRPAPEFEVASLRQCDTQTARGSQNAIWEPGGRVTATCMSLPILIADVWHVDYSVGLAGVPKLLSGPAGSITIVAKAPSGTAQDRDTLYALLRALLTDRYKMAIHYDERPADAYTLVAAKPKLVKADPEFRTGCTRQIQPAPGTRFVQYHMVCRNMTMAQFAEQIQAVDPGMVYPVIDGTHVDGVWDFTLDYDNSGSAFFQKGQRAASADDGGAALDPTGTISFSEALQRQLGLKLELQKRPEKVLVIDHMDEKPADN